MAANTEDLDNAARAIKSSDEQVNTLHSEAQSVALHIERTITTTSALGTHADCPKHLTRLLRESQVPVNKLIAAATASKQSLTLAHTKAKSPNQQENQPRIAEPASSESERRPADDLPPPIITPPTPLPSGVTDDPTTWPGTITQEHLHPRFRFSSEEQAIAKRLAQLEPGDIRAVPRGDGRTADSLFNGKTIEFKTLADSTGKNSTIKHILNRATANGGQSSDIIIDGRHTTLSPNEAVKGLFRFLNIHENSKKLTRVRIWGNSFDLDWKAKDNG